MLLLQQQQQQMQPQPQQQQVSRVHFQFDSHPALLLLNNVVDQDEGVYRCRVDFGRSPTRNVLVQLTVVGMMIYYPLFAGHHFQLIFPFWPTVPPQKIRIIEDNRQVSSVIGPYDEGGQLSLNCIVSGGSVSC